jgi:hypothetical protein
MKKILSMISFIVIALLAVSMVSAATIKEVKLDGDELGLKGVELLNLDRGNEVSLKVEVLGGSSDEEDLQIDARIRGYEHGDVESLYASSDVFDLKANSTHRETLKFNFPQRLKSQRYTLVVEVGNTDGTLGTPQSYEFEISGKRHELAIDDVVFSPAFNVEAGRALLTTVRIENFGEKDEEMLNMLMKSIIKKKLQVKNFS